MPVLRGWARRDLAQATAWFVEEFERTAPVWRSDLVAPAVPVMLEDVLDSAGIVAAASWIGSLPDDREFSRVSSRAWYQLLEDRKLELLPKTAAKAWSEVSGLWQ